MWSFLIISSKGTRHRLSLGLLCAFLVAPSLGLGAPFTIEEVKSAFLLNFGRFVEWPTQVIQKSPDRFTICLIGKDTLRHNLEAIVRDQKVKGRTLEVVTLAPDTAATACQIAYLNLGGKGGNNGNANDKQTLEVLSHLKASPTLTVGDNPNFLAAGGIIQLQIDGGHIHLKINLKAAKDSGLIISSKLLAIAEVVQ
ncbi:YfiR family protein [Bdellovibrionota bacterium FG-2]